MDFGSAIIYCIFLIVSCCLAWVTEKAHYNPIGILFTYAFIVCFWSIRYKIGFDYVGYMDIFYDIKHNRNSYVEPGFWLLNRCFAFSSIGYVWVLTIMTALSYFFLFKLFIRERILTYGIFFSIVFLLQFMLANQVRQAFVLVYFFYIFHYLEEKRYWKYILYLLPMFAFHFSVLALFLIIPFARIRFKKITWIFFIVITYILYLLGVFKTIGTSIMTVLPFYEIYQGTERMLAEDVGFSTVMLFKIFVALYLLIFENSIKRPVMMTVFLGGIVLYNVFIEFHLLGRIVNYFSYFNVILAALLCRNNIRNGSLILLFSAIVFLLLAGKEPAYHGTLPYQTIFSFSIDRY